MTDVFLSYKREDQATARRLAEALQLHGLTVWWDPHLQGGERFDEVIEEALRDSRCVVVMWSAAALASQYVRDEATYALNAAKLVPVRIELVDLPFRFSRLHTIDLGHWAREGNPEQMPTLVSAIAALLANNDLGATRGARSKADMTFHDAADIQGYAAAHLGQDVRWTNSVGLEFVLVPAGEFYYPAPKDRRREDLRNRLHLIAHPFWLSREVVGRTTWSRVMGTQPWTTAPNLAQWESYARKQLPEVKADAASYVTGSEAEEFCARLGDLEGRAYRLPSDVEWEYACRAGDYGNDRESPWGLVDMLCSNEQWCRASRPGADQRIHVACGGLNDSEGFYYGPDKRHAYPADRKSLELGFRVVTPV